MKKYDEKWNFKDYSMKELVHGIHSYPAMLMPMIVRTILKDVKDVNVFLDPYMGSGTSIVEAQLAKIKTIYGIDLNPMAIQITQTKIKKYNVNALKEEIKTLKDFNFNVIQHDTFNFQIINTWFKPDTITALSKIKKYINTKISSENKTFFVTCFSEIIRLTSMTRNGEFKLYRISKEKRLNWNPDVFSGFFNIIDRNLKSVDSYDKFEKSSEITLLQKSIIDINVEDIKDESVDLVITSPPYGDSKTTVAYGQFSRLSNEWLDIKNANKVDNTLLGGKVDKVNKNFIFGIAPLDESIKKIKFEDNQFNKKRHLDVISFYIDYEKAIKSISKTIKMGGTVVFVVGNRRVRNIQIPTDEITHLMFKKFGFVHKKTIIRDILNKRMPSKASNIDNKVGVIETMSKEYIVIMHKKNKVTYK